MSGRPETLDDRLQAAMAHAEKEAWNALARYKFYMFGYWAGYWVGLRALGQVKGPSPFRALVLHARGLGYGPDAGSVESLEAQEQEQDLPIPALLAAMSDPVDAPA